MFLNTFQLVIIEYCALNYSLTTSFQCLNFTLNTSASECGDREINNFFWNLKGKSHLLQKLYSYIVYSLIIALNFRRRDKKKTCIRKVAGKI